MSVNTRGLAIFSLLVTALGQTATAQDPAKLTALRQRAEAGDAQAHFDLGFMYETGTSGALSDLAEALRWYRRAAAQGNVSAKGRIAAMYFEGKGVPKDYSEAARWYGCPKPNVQALSSCSEISYEGLPKGALDLLKKIGCAVGSNYSYGSAVDLNGDGEPEYQVCCHGAPHGPCGAVVIGKIGSAWKELSPDRGVLGFADPCGLFVVLDSRHNGFSDICLPNECSMASFPTGKPCVPTVWNFVGGRYRSVRYVPEERAK